MALLAGQGLSGLGDMLAAIAARETTVGIIALLYSAVAAVALVARPLSHLEGTPAPDAIHSAP